MVRAQFISFLTLVLHFGFSGSCYGENSTLDWDTLSADGHAKRAFIRVVPKADNLFLLQFCVASNRTCTLIGPDEGLTKNDLDEIEQDLRHGDQSGSKISSSQLFGPASRLFFALMKADKTMRATKKCPLLFSEAELDDVLKVHLKRAARRMGKLVLRIFARFGTANPSHYHELADVIHAAQTVAPEPVAVESLTNQADVLNAQYLILVAQQIIIWDKL